MTGEIFHTRNGRIFLGWSNVKKTKFIEATICRGALGGGQTTTGFKFRCCPGTIGTLISGPKDWSPRPEPQGFCRWIEFMEGDRLVYSAGRHIGAMNCDRHGWFGLVKRPSPFALGLRRRKEK